MNYKKLNKNLLKKVLSIQTTSKDDVKMRSFVKSFAKEKNLPITEDDYGNLFITKGESKKGYPCMVSHMDTVHKILSDFTVFEHKDSLFAYSADGCHQVGIGGDDKVGVYACLQALIDFPVVKTAFFRDEEIGCLGSTKADMSYFDDCNFVIMLDRRENKDFSINAAGVQLSSKEFRTSIKHLLRKWRFKETITSITDVMKLKQRGLSVCATNIACGYYFPHFDYEVVIMSDVDRAYCLAHDIISEFGETRFEHKYVPKVYKPKLPFNYNKQSGSLLPWNPNPTPYVDIDNDEDRRVKYDMFRKYPGSKFPHVYWFKGKPLSLNNRYMYLPHERLLYDIEKNNYIINPDVAKELYKDFVVKDNGKEFVFSWYIFDWLDKSHAVWLNVGKSWWLDKKHLDRWKTLKNRGESKRRKHLSMDVLTKKLEMQLPMNMME